MTYVFKLILVTLTCFTAHTQTHFLARSSFDPICQSLCEGRCPSSIENQKKRMSGGDMISQQIQEMKDETVFKSCLSSGPDRCGLMCTIWLIAVNMVGKTNESFQHINLTFCRQTEVTQLGESRFNIWRPNLWMHQMFDAFQQGTGSIKIKLGCCQLFGCESTFWGNSPTPESLLMYMQKHIHHFKSTYFPQAIHLERLQTRSPPGLRVLTCICIWRPFWSAHPPIHPNTRRRLSQEIKSEMQLNAHKGSDQ